MIGEAVESDQRSKLRGLVLTAGVVSLIVSLTWGIAAGAVSVSLQEIYEVFTTASGQTDNYRIVYYLRMPRVICAALTGMNLALAGCILQAILRNPLADPGIIGISSGAGFAAMALMLIMPEMTYFVPVAAFGGALAATTIVFLLSWEKGINPLRLILAGVAVAAFFGGGTTALSVFFSDRIQGTVNWLAGGFAGSNWNHVLMILPYSAVGISAALCSCRKLNALQLGDEVAVALGVNVAKTRLILIGVAALLAASAVSVAGLIGFIGLIIPHVMRLIVGSDFEHLLPASAVFGAVLAVGADTVARTAFSPLEVPVGIFLSFLGAPFFLYLLKRRMRS